ncbi:MAG: hypothetical protein KJO49_03410 [Bacteroidia bacterium]|nr:hypothetical protein [Bacteroidia bacterium]MBT8270251.1 hypothetical protein [Bacteroidia bacterium]NNK69090.1 hypothetical protein [Flavobacteriaceae bacterium]
MKKFKLINLALALFLSFAFLSFTDGDDNPVVNRGDDESSQTCHTEYHVVWGVGGLLTVIVVPIEVCD